MNELHVKFKFPVDLFYIYIPSKDINFFVSLPVRANPRVLRATWTPEIAQDIAAYHGLDIEEEIEAALIEQMAIDNNLRRLS